MPTVTAILIKGDDGLLILSVGMLSCSQWENVEDDVGKEKEGEAVIMRAGW